MSVRKNCKLLAQTNSHLKSNSVVLLAIEKINIIYDIHAICLKTLIMKYSYRNIQMFIYKDMR